MPRAPELNCLEYLPQRMWLIEYPVRFAGMNLTARATLIRLEGGTLFVHSPCPFSDPLRRQLANLGQVAYVVAPGNFHTLHSQAWRNAYPQAELWVCPGLEGSYRGRARPHVLTDVAPVAWRRELKQVVVRGRFMREVVFFDRVSHTLIVTDLIENYGDLSKHVPGLLRMWWRLFGMWNHPGPAPEYRLGWRDKACARASLARVLEWDFTRIVLAHGDLIERDARATARLAWRSVLDGPV